MGLFTSSKQKKKEEMTKVANTFVADIKQKGGLQPIETSILLKKDEKGYLEESEITLKETRMMSKRSGGGVGVRLFKGVYVGGYKGESRSHPELRGIDMGKLVLTNKRLIFDGKTENRIIELNKVLSIEPYLDAIEISTEDRAKSFFFFVKNPYVWITVFQILRNASDPENLKDINLSTEFK